MNSTKTILVTGVNGFVGPHLVRELTGRDCTVIGVGYNEAAPKLENPLAQYIPCDLTNAKAVKQIDFSSADAIIHLAGLTSMSKSFAHPARYIADNSTMLINVFEALLQQKLARLPRMVVVSSGAVYDSDQPMPVNETAQLAYESPYSISKILSEHLCGYYRHKGLECIVARPFNHTGPGQGPGFLIPDLVSQVLVAGSRGTIHVGNLDAKRDFTDVRDIARAYADIALADTLSHDLYNLCSGIAWSANEVLQLILTACFGNTAAVKTELDPQKLRPNEAHGNILFGDNSRAKTDINWQPEIAFKQTIKDYIVWMQADKVKH